jgi:hypothetical protein
VRSHLLCLVLILLCGCGSSSEPDNPGVAASLTVQSGGSQQAEVGTELPTAVVVKVADGSGTAVPNQIVNFVVVSGGGTVFAGTAQTNAQGEARERWTLGPPAGEQALEARAVDPTTGDPLVFARITATGVPGPAIEILLRPGLSPIFVGQQLDVAPLVVARDRYVNIISDPPLTLTAEPPFQVDGTLLSSTAEVEGSITLTSGEASPTRFVTAIRNLDVLVGGTGGWACSGSAAYSVGESGVVYMTHRTTSFTVDSVLYVIEPSSFSSPGLAHAQIFTTMTTISTLEDGTTRTSSDELGGVEGVQRPGRLDFGSFSQVSGTATLVSESPLTYSGGNGCNGWTLTDSEQFTMSK